MKNMDVIKCELCEKYRNETHSNRLTVVHPLYALNDKLTGKEGWQDFNVQIVVCDECMTNQVFGNNSKKFDKLAADKFDDLLRSMHMEK